MRHFTVTTTSGKTEDIYCDDIDDSQEHEIWFIFHDKAPLIFQRSGIVSRQEHEPFDQKKWDANVRSSQIEATYDLPTFDDYSDTSR